MKNVNLLFLLPFILFTFCFIGSCSEDKAIPQADSKRPNILLIMTDDQGYGDLACHGNPNIKTPNLDRWSEQSVRFTNFHVGTTCAPTRAGLMSGMNCNRVGAWHTVNGRSFLSTKYQSMASHLKSGGYRTGIFGKWHLGDNYPYRPQDRGFDESLIHGGGGVGQTPDYWNNDYFDDTYFYNGKPKKYQGYCTDVWFDEAIAFVKKSATEPEPFFCYISTNAPHGPFHVPQKYIDLYKDNEAIPNPNFYGMITNFDENLGRLEQALKVNGMYENTILVFMTDNGTAAGARFDEEGHAVEGFNAGMRGKKGSEYEGGHRVPLFIQFPEGMKISKGVYDELANYTDIIPTLLDVVELPQPKNYQFDGLSLKPLLESGKQEGLADRIVIVDTQREEEMKKYKQFSIMQNSWRLVNNKELYDLSTDPGQRKNVIENHVEIAERLKAAYEPWWADIESDFQIDNRLIVGSANENPMVLTSHDWHTNQDPPWNQGQIREAKVSNGYWLIDVEKAGMYTVKLSRWPLTLAQQANEDLPIGDEVIGGKPYPVGQGLKIVEAKLKIENQELIAEKMSNGQYFEFELNLEKGPAQLQTWMIDERNVERGAYYVKVERTQ